MSDNEVSDDKTTAALQKIDELFIEVRKELDDIKKRLTVIEAHISDCNSHDSHNSHH